MVNTLCRKIAGSARLDAGFTLVEMTVVVAILAVIASMTVPSVRGLIFEGRGTGKAADLREMTVVAARYLGSERSFPTPSGGLPPVDVADANDDGIVRVVIDTASADGDGIPPTGVDATCSTATTDIAVAISQCFVPVDFAKTREYIFNLPEHALEDVTDAAGAEARFDADPSTADLVASNISLNGETLEIFVLDDGGAGGTAFPAGALKVWSVVADGRPWVIKSDIEYGRK